jgi:hypothetical protein
MAIETRLNYAADARAGVHPAVCGRAAWRSTAGDAALGEGRLTFASRGLLGPGAVARVALRWPVPACPWPRCEVGMACMRGLSCEQRQHGARYAEGGDDNRSTAAKGPRYAEDYMVTAARRPMRVHNGHDGLRSVRAPSGPELSSASKEKTRSSRGVYKGNAPRFSQLLRRQSTPSAVSSQTRGAVLCGYSAPRHRARGGEVAAGSSLSRRAGSERGAGLGGPITVGRRPSGCWAAGRAVDSRAEVTV